MQSSFPVCIYTSTYYVCVPVQDGNTALHCASATNQVAILQLLLSPPHSCIVDIRTCYDETPLHVACLNGHLDAAQLLVEKGADLCIRDGKGNTTLHLSAAGGSCKLIRWIMREKNCEGLLNAQNKVKRVQHCHKMELS